MSSLIDALLLEAYRDPREIYIALRTDSQRGSGSLDDPYSGDTSHGSRFSVTLNKDTGDLTNRTVIASLASGVTHGLIEHDVVTLDGLSGTGLAYAGTFPVFEVNPNIEVNPNS